MLLLFCKTVTLVKLYLGNRGEDAQHKQKSSYKVRPHDKEELSLKVEVFLIDYTLKKVLRFKKGHVSKA